MRIFIVVIIIAAFIGCVPTQQIADTSIPQILVQILSLHFRNQCKTHPQRYL